MNPTHHNTPEPERDGTPKPDPGLAQRVQALEQRLDTIQKAQATLQNALTRIYEDQRRRERIL